MRINIYGKQSISREGFMKFFNDIFHLKYQHANSYSEERKQGVILSIIYNVCAF